MLDMVLAKWRKRITKYREAVGNDAAGKAANGKTAAALLAEMDQVVNDFIALTIDVPKLLDWP